MHGIDVEILDEAKRQFQVARDKWFEWADRASGNGLMFRFTAGFD